MYYNTNTQALKEDLLKWSNNFASKYMSMKTVDEMHTEFQTALKSAMNSHVLTKITTKRNQTPWMNRRIKRLHKHKQSAIYTHNIHRNQASHDNFCKAHKNAHKETRKAHRRYIVSICSDSAKRFWSYIKSLKVDTIGISTLTKDHQTESDIKLKASMTNSNQSSQKKMPTFQKNHTQTYQLCLTLPSQQREWPN